MQRPCDTARQSRYLLHARKARVLICLVTLVSLAGFAKAQTPDPANSQSQGPAEPPPPSVLPSTTEGDWIRVDTSGSGSWDGLLAKYPKAELTDTGKKLLDSLPARQLRIGENDPAHPLAAGQALVTNPTPCIFAGSQLPLEYDSEGFHLIISKKVAVFTAERGGSRVAYLDGRSVPTPDERAPTPSGYSVAHIQPDGTLVVVTTDMTPARVTSGGVRSTATKVTQRYIPSADGRHLKQILTWEDPVLYKKPHTYEYQFDRMPKDSYIRDVFCDASNPQFGQSVIPPE
jgi:hypothetical protein